MKYLLASFRIVLVVLNTALQISILVVDGWINGKTIERNFKHRRRWARTSMFILGIKIDEHLGEFSGKQALIISNHRTLLDPVVQAAYLDAYIIAKAEVSKLPVISQGAQMTGIIFVKREKLRSRLAARNMTKDVLLGGNNVLVYAEGTTGTNRTTDNFKVGTFVIAAENNLPVVPVAIDYPLEKDYWYKTSMATQVFGQIGKWRTRVKLRICEPITNTDPQKLMTNVREEIDQNLVEMQTDWSQIFTNQGQLK